MTDSTERPSNNESEAQHDLKWWAKKTDMKATQMQNMW